MVPWRPPISAFPVARSALQTFTICNTRRQLFRSCTAFGAYHNVASVLKLPASPADDTARTSPRQVEITGHVRTIRNQKRRSFVEIGDGSTTATLQALLEPAQATGLGTGTSVRISGSWQESPHGKEQTHELHAQRVEILGQADPDVYPLQKKYHSSEFLRTMPHLRLRVPFNALIARLRSDCDHYISNYFRAQQFVRTHPPIITSSDCEGAGEVFTLQPARQGHARQEEEGNTEAVGHDSNGPSETPAQSGSTSSEPEQFFREPKYLTVSSQLHLEAYVHEHQRVWTMSPTFRAEKSDTPRHLSEFYMLEAELRSTSLDEVMDTVEGLIRSIATSVEDSPVGRELLQPSPTDSQPAQPPSPASPDHPSSETRTRDRAALVRQRWHGLKKPYWPRVPYSAAIKLLEAASRSGEASFRYPPSWAAGLQLEHEKFLAAEIGLGSPVFITDYPAAVKPFYMLPSQGGQGSAASPATAGTEAHEVSPGGAATQQSGTVACFDLLLPDLCEVVGGSLREHRLPALEAAMDKHGVAGLEWYLDLRRFGSVPHGGFGLGFDRLVGYLAGVDNVRDVVPWPRYYGKCDG